MYEYLSILQSLYPHSRGIDIHYKNNMPSGLLCFRELVRVLIASQADHPHPHPVRRGGRDPSQFV